MQKIENKTLQKFLERFIEALKYENGNHYDLERDTKDLDIPLIISSLYQSFQNNISDYVEFISDLEKYSDYGFCFERSRNTYCGIVDVYVYLSEYKPDNNEENKPNYDYLISFTYDFRDYGYCECTPDMEGYREDKKCCGHGCDAAFCEFLLQKISYIKRYSWNGDEHAYWDFEDEFYAGDKELEEKKTKEDKERKIRSLKETIEEATKKLAEQLY